jgi:CDP-diglyceride synthetase
VNIYSHFSLEKIKENKLMTLVQVILMLWIFSIPLKNALYQITTVLLIVLFFVHLIYYKQKEQLQELWITYKQLFFLFLAFILTMLLSSFVGLSDHKAFSEILKYIYRYPLILFILFYFYKQSYFNRKWLLSVIFIALFIHAMDGIYQYITGFDLIKHIQLPISKHLT